MTFDPAKSLIAYHEALARLDFEAIEPMFAPDASYISKGVGALRGREEILAAFRAYFAEFPDQQTRDVSVVSMDANTASAVWELEARSLITGAVSRRSGTEIIRYDALGKMVGVEVADT